MGDPLVGERRGYTRTSFWSLLKISEMCEASDIATMVVVGCWSVWMGWDGMEWMLFGK